MSYLLDKKIKRKKLSHIALGVVLLILLFYFGKPVARGFSYVAVAVFKPVLIVGQGVGRGFSNIGTFFASKKSLTLENENLKLQISQSEADRANYSSVVDENIQLKEILGRKKENQNFIVSAILSKPNKSPYDTLVIDVGTNKGAIINQRVFALGNIPVGRIVETYPNSSKVLMYSNPGEKTQIVITGKNTYLDAIGRGGGNFEIVLPKDFTLENGTEAVLPGVTSYVLGTVVKTISDPRDAFIKALLVSPVNIQSQKFVEVER